MSAKYIHEHWKKSLGLGGDEFEIKGLSGMECLLMTAHESELGTFGGQIKIGTAVKWPKEIKVNINFPGMPEIGVRSLEHALFQARMWREYAQTFDSRRTANGINADWVRNTLNMSRRDCLDRAHVWLMAARDWNEQAAAIKRKGSRWVNVAGMLACSKGIEGPEVVEEPPWRRLPSSVEFDVNWEPTPEGKKYIESFSVRPKVGTRVRFVTPEGKEYAGVVTAINPDGSFDLKIEGGGASE